MAVVPDGGFNKFFDGVMGMVAKIAGIDEKVDQELQNAGYTPPRKQLTGDGGVKNGGYGYQGRAAMGLIEKSDVYNEENERMESQKEFIRKTMGTDATFPKLPSTLKNNLEQKEGAPCWIREPDEHK